MKTVTRFIQVLLVSIFFFSCEESSSGNEKTIDVQFGYQNKTDSRNKAVNKTPAAIIMTIVQGATTIHQDIKLPVTNFNGNIVTQPLALKVGNYTLTDYKVVNSGDTVIYATPVEGSTAAALVQDALNIDFTVTANGSALIQPEVIDTEEFTPEQFGFTSSGFNIVPTFHFLVSVSIFDVNTGSYVLTTSNIEVKMGSKTDFNDVVSAETKVIEVRDFNDSNYTVIVTKDGFLDWSQTYTNAVMKTFDGVDAGESPLSVVLQKDPNYGLVSTLAGSTQGYADGTGSAARFFNPYGVDVDAAGNVYVVDLNNHRIRKITPAGVVTTVAGSGAAGFADGNGTLAQFNTPTTLELDAAGNIYVCDFNNQRIRKIAPNGDVTTIAGNGTAGYVDANGASAQFNYPRGIAVDGSGNVFVGDTGNDRIRKIAPNGDVTTIATVNDIFELAMRPNGDMVATEGHLIRNVTQAGVVTTIAGSAQGFSDGNGTSAQFDTPTGIDIDAAGVIYVMEQYGQRARRIATNGDVVSIAGTGVAGNVDGTGAVAQFSYARGIAVDSNGNLYIGDEGNHTVRKISF